MAKVLLTYELHLSDHDPRRRAFASELERRYWRPLTPLRGTLFQAVPAVSVHDAYRQAWTDVYGALAVVSLGREDVTVVVSVSTWAPQVMGRGFEDAHRASSPSEPARPSELAGPSEPAA